MEEWQAFLRKILNEELDQMVFSNSRDKETAFKVKVRPILTRQELLFQETLYRGTQVFHHNYRAEEMEERALVLTPELFRQVEVQTRTLTGVVLASKKGNLTVRVKNRVEAEATQGQALSHDRVKKYLLPEGRPVDFLVGLGVQTAEGKVTKAKYDKFRQINRYLEFIEDVMGALPEGRTLRIIDFGCGKSYLTFAMYYYLHELHGRDVRITGLDLKEDVIDRCNRLAGACGYRFLSFEKGDISTYEGADQVDMVVSLHACDTATDYAPEKAVRWGARVIMAVPCCQHEVNRQIRCRELEPVLRYGVIKERLSALVTDAMRANLLEEQGYDTQILEFIDMEHTPKNLLIRAVKRDGMRPGKRNRSDELAEYLHISPTLLRLFQKTGEIRGMGSGPSAVPARKAGSVPGEESAHAGESGSAAVPREVDA